MAVGETTISFEKTDYKTGESTSHDYGIYNKSYYACAFLPCNSLCMCLIVEAFQETGQLKSPQIIILLVWGTQMGTFEETNEQKT